MAKNSHKPKQTLPKPSKEELMKRDAMAFAQLLYDIYQEKKRKEKNNDASSSL